MRHYPSKLLLFGEYILLLGARALATPVPSFYGHWAQAGLESSENQRAALERFARSEALKSIAGLDVRKFEQDVADGQFFQSNIPQGYGLGSSGALCAAVYDRYVLEKTADLSELKAIFARMESYFHGKSSGIDPLTSYLNRPLWIDNVQDVQTFTAKPWKTDAPAVFLLDTRQERQTGPLVEWFLEQSRKPFFLKKLDTELYPAHRNLLDAWQNCTARHFWTALQTVSTFQLENMPPMIPESVRPVWEKCLENGEVLLKICGAGGGGFMQRFARNKNLAIELCRPFTLTFPFEKHELVEK